MKKHRPLTVYFILAYLFSWLVFVPLALNKQGVIFLFPQDAAHARILDFWHAFGGIGPFLAAVITILVFYGKDRLRLYFQAFSLKKLTPMGWLLSLSPLLLFGATLIVHRFVYGEWFSVSGFFQSNDLRKPAHLLAWIFPLLTYGFGEEAGWRGFALPKLQFKYPALMATTILALLWVGWHLPSFFYRYQLSGSMLVGFLLGVYAGAIILTFIFNFTKGNILAVGLFHLTFNFVSMIGTPAFFQAVMSTVVMVMAVVVVVRFKHVDLSPHPKNEWQENSAAENRE